MTFRTPRLAVAALAAVLLVGAACSDDDSDAAEETSTAADDPAPSSEDDGEADTSGDAEADADEAADDDSGRPFSVDDDGLAESMKSATGADRVEVDGSTFRLVFSDGSAEDMSANINCTAMNHLKGDDDSVVLVYPDGEVSCDG